ncbi:hypothetical protein [Rhodococcus sp. T7]|uniref:hypothetical protein n=1 Tax=Rhodococcus sp. T7 TaxID=627444 RepID=UPI00135BCA38|nr:hypothetical protein [Rhodococcus sp. T7]KAF0956902.1 hypothetical protein MLGJGCBP_09982 [Rhodococcus sp. T7]KAF0958670.1 hypothetical protein MLGJGCBP_08242 [Rhodococcus sp. T7]
MTNFLALNGDAPGLTHVVAVRLPTIEDVFQFLGPWAGYLMVLGGIAALVGYISSTGLIGRMNMSKEGTVLLSGLAAFVLGFMVWLG